MLLVGLTGGIGSGKSTVGRLLAERGAIVVQADELARAALEPGAAGHAAVVREFGRGILLPGGEIDREGLAGLVFSDGEARRRLEAIVHPEVGRRFAEIVRRHRTTDHVVVYDVPLLVEAGLRDAFDLVVTVVAPEEARIARLSAERGMGRQAARRRMAAQASDEARRRAADVVIRNDASVDDLAGHVDELWTDLSRRARSGGGGYPRRP